MKKFVIALAAVATGFAATADVSSANTVGYTTKSIAAGGYLMIGTQFNETGAATKGAIDMNDLIRLSSTITSGTYDDDFATAPQIMVWKAAGGYDYYYYISDGTYDEDGEDPIGHDEWCDKDGIALDASSKLALGKGFWFYSPVSGGTITTSGEVSDIASTNLAFTAGSYAILCNPFPKAVSLQSITTTGCTAGTYDDDFATAPQIMVWKAAGGYDYYYYISDGTYDEDGEDPIGHNEWCDKDGIALEGAQIDAGGSFWITSPTAGSLTFSL